MTSESYSPNLSMEGRLTTVEAVEAYMMAGNATFTLRSQATGTRFTYKVRKSKPQPGRDQVWFVSLLTGEDNENSFTYMGLISTDGCHFRHTNASTISTSAPSFKAFSWFFNTLKAKRTLHPSLEIWHDGRCGRCGRKLTVPESVAAGIGPECASKM